MDELARKVGVARKGLAPEKDEAWLDKLGRDFQVRRRSRAKARRVSWGIACVATVAMAVIAVGKLRRDTSNPTNVPANVAAALTPLRISDGSMATPFDDLTVLRMNEASETRAVMELVRGGARFTIAHRPSRLFQVVAGPAVVEVLGTEFTVERTAGRVRVSVLTGQVQVVCEGRTSQLVEGETGIFPRTRPESDREGNDSPLVDDPARPSGPMMGSRPPDSQMRNNSAGVWRALASQGKWPEAYQALERDGWPDSSDPSSLLAAADVARRTHHPGQAVAPLRKLIEGYAKDPRASAAAFTLGRVLMETGDHREAALAFAKARSLDRQGAISEDALAREVEAWSRAGDRDRARARADEYVLHYPSGRRLASVRQYGGLE